MTDVNLDFLALAGATFGVCLGILGYRRSSIASLSLIGSMIASIGAGWLLFRTIGSPSELVIQSPESWRQSISLALSTSKAIGLFIHVAFILAICMIARSNMPSRLWILPATAANLCFALNDPLSIAVAFFAAHVALSISPVASSPSLLASMRLLGGALVVVATAVGVGSFETPFGNPAELRRTATIAFACGATLSLLGIMRTNANDDPIRRIYGIAGPLFLIAALGVQFDAFPLGRTWTAAVSLSIGAFIAVAANLWVLAFNGKRIPESRTATSPSFVAWIETQFEQAIAIPTRIIASSRRSDLNRPISAAAMLTLTAAACLVAIAVGLRSSGVSR